MDNTPEELEAAVIEMLESVTLPDETNPLSELQTKFNSLRGAYGTTVGTTISETFSKKYRPLIS